MNYWIVSLSWSWLRKLRALLSHMAPLFCMFDQYLAVIISGDTTHINSYIRNSNYYDRIMTFLDFANSYVSKHIYGCFRLSATESVSTLYEVSCIKNTQISKPSLIGHNIYRIYMHFTKMVNNILQGLAILWGLIFCRLLVNVGDCYLSLPLLEATTAIIYCLRVPRLIIMYLVTNGDNIH